MAEKCHYMLIRGLGVSGRVMVWPSLHIWTKSPGVWKRGWWVMSVKAGLGNGKAPHYTWHEHHGGRTVILVRFGRIYLQNNDTAIKYNVQMRQHSWIAVTRGMESIYLGMSSGTAVPGSSSRLKMQLSHGRRKVSSLYETSASVSPNPYFQGLIIRSATEFGSIEVLKYKHLKAML